MSFYDLRRFAIETVALDSRAAKSFDWFLGPFASAVQPEGLPTARIECLSGPVPDYAQTASGGAEFRLQGSSGLLRAQTGGLERIWRPGHFALELDMPGAGARIWQTESAADADVGLAAVFAMDHAMRAGGAFLLHCACLDLPGGAGRILLHAPSGTGKTTTALALAAAGFALSGDDTAIICPSADGVEALGLPRPARVSRATVAMLPFLEQLVSAEKWDVNDEQEITRQALGEVIPLAETEFMPVAALLTLQRDAQAPLAAARTGAADVLSALLAESLRPGADGLSTGDTARFDVIARLFDSVPVWRLNLSGTPAAIAAKVKEVFQG